MYSPAVGVLLPYLLTCLAGSLLTRSLLPKLYFTARKSAWANHSTRSRLQKRRVLLPHLTLCFPRFLRCTNLLLPVACLQQRRPAVRPGHGDETPTDVVWVVHGLASARHASTANPTLRKRQQQSKMPLHQKYRAQSSGSSMKKKRVKLTAPPSQQQHQKSPPDPAAETCPPASPPPRDAPVPESASPARPPHSPAVPPRLHAHAARSTSVAVFHSPPRRRGTARGQGAGGGWRWGLRSCGVCCREKGRGCLCRRRCGRLC